MRFHELVDRPNLFVKIPGTEPGLGAIEDCIAAGRSINITLIFSLERHAEVIEAYLRGLERLVADGGDPAPVASVASFFVSRVDTEADRRLAGARSRGASGKARDREREARVPAVPGCVLRGPLGGARRGGSERAALSLGVDLDEEPRVPRRALCRGADRPETINTMPLETVTAFQDHGAVRNTLTEGVEEAHELLEGARRSRHRLRRRRRHARA